MAITAERGLAHLHEMEFKDIQDIYVTDESRWSDDHWYFSHQTPGQKRSASLITWAVMLPDGELLTAPAHSQMLDWMKRLLISLMYAPNERGTALSAGSVSNFSSGLRDVAKWMVFTGRSLPHELGPRDIAEFVEDLPDILVGALWEDDASNRRRLDSENGIGEHQVACRLKIFQHLWRQRRELEKAGIKPMPTAPFHDETTQSIVSSIATKARSRIKAIPDEVAVPLFNAAARLLGLPSEDIVNLFHGVHELEFCSEVEDKYRNKLKLARRRFVDRFSFHTLPGEAEAWHPRISVAGTENVDDPLRRFNVVRRLSSRLRTACHIIIQGMTGMRISEICGIKAGVDEQGFPVNVHIEESASGLYELFLLSTELSKTVNGNACEDWLLGMRPKGSKDIPLPVLAIQILDRLYRPWREMAGIDALFISFSNPYGFPSSADSIRPADANALVRDLKRFASREIDYGPIPDTSKNGIGANDLSVWKEMKGQCISSHQFRKSFAQFIFDTDNTLLPAIQQQFKHVSLAMSEKGYVLNSIQKFDLESVRAQQSGLLMLDALKGGAFAGKRWDRMQESVERLQKEIGGKTPSEMLVSILREHDVKEIKMFFDTHGVCIPTQPHKMKCHQVDTDALVPKGIPNISTRNPTLCAGCDCFLVQRRHGKFWEARYVNYMSAFVRAERNGKADTCWVFKKRAMQSRAFLKRLGWDMSRLDALVTEAVDG